MKVNEHILNLNLKIESSGRTVKTEVAVPVAVSLCVNESWAKRKGKLTPCVI